MSELPLNFNQNPELEDDTLASVTELIPKLPTDLAERIDQDVLVEKRRIEGWTRDEYGWSTKVVEKILAYVDEKDIDDTFDIAKHLDTLNSSLLSSGLSKMNRRIWTLWKDGVDPEYVVRDKEKKTATILSTIPSLSRRAVYLYFSQTPEARIDHPDQLRLRLVAMMSEMAKNAAS